MAAPLIVGEARVMGGSSKAQQRSATSAERPALLRRIREQEQGQDEISLEEDQRQQQIANTTKMRQGTRLLHRLNNRLRGTSSNANTNIKRVRATTAALTIFSTAIAFYVPQLTLWIIGVIGLSTESVPMVDWLVPGTELYMFTWILIALIGLCTMIYATIVFTLRGVKCFEGWKGLIFIICITGYLILFLNIFPWFIIWIFSVSYLQKEAE